jgi:hypothetical protein
VEFQSNKGVDKWSSKLSNSRSLQVLRITAPEPLKYSTTGTGQRTRTDIQNVQGRKLHMKKTLTAAVVGLSLAAVSATAALAEPIRLKMASTYPSEPDPAGHAW